MWGCLTLQRHVSMGGRTVKVTGVLLWLQVRDKLSFLSQQTVPVELSEKRVLLHLKGSTWKKNNYLSASSEVQPGFTKHSSQFNRFLSLHQNFFAFHKSPLFPTSFLKKMVIPSRQTVMISGFTHSYYNCVYSFIFFLSILWQLDFCWVNLTAWCNRVDQWIKRDVLRHLNI